MISKQRFLDDLRQQIDRHCNTVVNTFGALSDELLAWQPPGKRGKSEWNILQCFEHLNLTHDYYMDKLTPLLSTAPRAAVGGDGYASSFWGGVYMYFALNPSYSFPSPEPIAPTTQPDRQVLNQYLAHQERLLEQIDAVASVNLVKTMVPIEKFVRFNLGDCLKILVYHDELHIGQAQRVYAEQRK